MTLHPSFSVKVIENNQLSTEDYSSCVICHNYPVSFSSDSRTRIDHPRVKAARVDRHNVRARQTSAIKTRHALWTKYHLCRGSTEEEV